MSKLEPSSKCPKPVRGESEACGIDSPATRIRGADNEYVCPEHGLFQDETEYLPCGHAVEACSCSGLDDLDNLPDA